MIPTPLIPIIIGGSSRPVGNNQTVLLDASETIDPDISNQQAASLLYKWQCYCKPKNSSISSLDTDCKNSSWSVEKQLLIPPGILSLNCHYVYILSVKRIGGKPVNTTQKVMKIYKGAFITVLLSLSLYKESTSHWLPIIHLFFFVQRKVIGWALAILKKNLFLTHLNEQHETDPDSNISRHFNSSNHSTDDMTILGLLFAPTNTTKRKTLEKRIIFKLGTLFPAGLNKQFNYLQ